MHGLLDNLNLKKRAKKDFVMKAYEYLARANSVKGWEEACEKVYVQLQHQMAGKSTHEIDAAWRRIKDKAIDIKLRDDDKLVGDGFLIEGVDSCKVWEAVYKQREQLKQPEPVNPKENAFVLKIMFGLLIGIPLFWHEFAWFLIFLILIVYKSFWNVFKGMEVGVGGRIFGRSIVTIVFAMIIWFVASVSGIIPYEKHYCESLVSKKERSQCYTKIWNDAQLEGEKEILRLKMKGEWYLDR